MDKHPGVDTIYLALKRGVPPSWASSWGEDEYGFFVAFTIKKATQRLRWIPPGSFMMGSPENEHGRHDDEGPQHKVTFDKGFWLSDTACTQELWQAVMGENPSKFTGEKNPVEQVSWEDVQGFIAKIKAAVPGLELGLPGEAQWEYGCRAGTKTPFGFGATVTTDQVNYDGNHPYLEGENNGTYRKKTLPVASLPANAWGLYEMHGNVWEWCEDIWHGNYAGAPQNGAAWLQPETASQPGVMRVVRGGSWINNARNVRSACRNHVRPVDRNLGLGFRCLLVQA